MTEVQNVALYMFLLEGGRLRASRESRGESGQAWASGAALGTIGADSHQEEGPPGHVADDETLAPQMGGSTSKALCRIGCLIFILALIFPEIG